MSLGRRHFTKSLLGAAAAASAPSWASGGAKKPNILYVFSDQHRAAAMGCYGDGNVETPHFDAFAGQGMRCTNFVCNTPVCCPSRATLMTGLYAHRHGVVTNGIPLDTGFPHHRHGLPGRRLFHRIHREMASV